MAFWEWQLHSAGTFFHCAWSWFFSLYKYKLEWFIFLAGQRSWHHIYLKSKKSLPRQNHLSVKTWIYRITLWRKTKGQISKAGNNSPFDHLNMGEKNKTSVMLRVKECHHTTDGTIDNEDRILRRTQSWRNLLWWEGTRCKRSYW